MLTFLRKIRRSLIESGSTRRYLLYAIGEIALVVIGILIALQINNWNEARKNRLVEQNLYENLLTNLQGDSLDLVRVLNRVNGGTESQKIIIENTYESLINKYSIDEIRLILHRITNVGISFFPRYNAYNQITNNGFLPLLKSEKIRNSLVELYERHYSLYKHVDDVVEQKNQFDLHPVISGDLLAQALINELKTPERFDHEKLKLHYDELGKQCRSSYYITNTSRDILGGLQEEVSDLIMNIRGELKSH